jgi:ABC-2 type transport system permease protein
VLTYQLCLRWFGRERLDSFMTATQVIVSVVLVLGSQLVPQLMIRNEGLELISVDRWWTALLPPSWFAGLDDAIAGSGSSRSWMLAAIGTAVTAGVMWIAFGRLASDYQTGIGTMTETASRRPERTRRKILSRLVNAPPLRWWLRDPVSRASFLLSAAYLARDRDTKLRMYPGIAPMLVMPIILLLPRGSDSHGPGAFGVAFAGSYLGLVPLLALGMLSLSQQWQASDIFRSAPVRGPAALSHGARRAVLVLVMIPMLILFALIVLVMGQRKEDLMLMLPGLVALPVYAMIPCLGGKAVPLSRPPDEAKAARRTSLTMLVMFSSAALAGAAAFMQKIGWFWPFLAVETAIAATAYFLMRRSLSNESWASLE